jgi:hypothetical protein
MSDNPAGWQPDPSGKHDHRYWDGTQWTDNVADAGVASTDPYVAPAPPPVEPAAPEPAAPEPAAPEPAAEAPAPIDGATTPGEEPTAVTAVPSGDDTTTYPVAGGVIPPYQPPSPTPDGGAGGGSKRSLIIGGAILAVVAIAVIAFFALGGDDGPDVRAQLAGAIAADTDVSSGQAECIADLVIDETGEDAFADTDFDAEDPPPEFISAVLSIGLETIAEECDIDEAALGGTDSSTDSSDPTEGDGEETVEDLRDQCADGDFSACDDLYYSAELGSELETFGSTCGGIAEPQEGSCEATNGGEDPIELDFDELYDDVFAEMGLTEEQAECLAERLQDAIDDGEMTQEEALAGFAGLFTYLADCDIDLEDLDPSSG